MLWRWILLRVFFRITYSACNNAFLGVFNQPAKTLLRTPKVSLDHVSRLSLFDYFCKKTLKTIIGPHLENFNIPWGLPENLCCWFIISGWCFLFLISPSIKTLESIYYSIMEVATFECFDKLLFFNKIFANWNTH